MELLVDGHHGIYVWQSFAEMCETALRESGLGEDVDILLAGPDHEYYWEAIDNVEQEFRGSHGETLYQGESGDLWLLERNETVNDYGEITVGTYLMNPKTGTVLTENEWWEVYKSVLLEKWGGPEFEDAGLIEVVRNFQDEEGYDPTCGEWRPADVIAG